MAIRSDTASPESGTRATILFADDEPVLREVVSMALERAGFEVRLAEDAAEAARVLASDPGVSLAVLDWGMPGDGGAALVRYARTARPALPLVISSGVIDDEVRAVRANDGGVHLLQKPWRARALLALIADVLGAPRAE